MGSRAKVSPQRRYPVSPATTVAYIRSQMRAVKGAAVPMKESGRGSLGSRPQSFLEGTDRTSRYRNTAPTPVLDDTNTVFGIDASRCPVYEKKKLSIGEGRDYRVNDLDRARSETRKDDAFQAQQLCRSSQTAGQSIDLANAKHSQTARQSIDLANAKHSKTAGQSIDLANAKHSQTAGQSIDLANAKHSQTAGQSIDLANAKHYPFGNAHAHIEGVKRATLQPCVESFDAKPEKDNAEIMKHASESQHRKTTGDNTRADVRIGEFHSRSRRFFGLRSLGSIKVLEKHGEMSPRYQPAGDDEKKGNFNENHQFGNQFLESRDFEADQKRHSPKDGHIESDYPEAKRLKVDHVGQPGSRSHSGRGRGNGFETQGENTAGVSNFGFPFASQKSYDAIGHGTVRRENTFRSRGMYAQVAAEGDDRRSRVAAAQGNGYLQANRVTTYPSQLCGQFSGAAKLTKTESLTWDPGETAMTSTPLKPQQDMTSTPLKPQQDMTSTPLKSQQKEVPMASIMPSDIGHPCGEPMHRASAQQINVRDDTRGHQFYPNLPSDSAQRAGMQLNANVSPKKEISTPAIVQPKARNPFFRAFTQLQRRDRKAIVPLPKSAPTVPDRHRHGLKSKINLKPVNLFPDTNPAHTECTNEHSMQFSHSNSKKKTKTCIGSNDVDLNRENTIGAREFVLNPVTVWEFPLSEKKPLTHMLSTTLAANNVESNKDQRRVKGYIANGPSKTFVQKIANSVHLPTALTGLLSRSKDESAAPIRHAKSVDIAAIYSHWRPRHLTVDSAMNGKSGSTHGHAKSSEKRNEQIGRLSESAAFCAKRVSPNKRMHPSQQMDAQISNVDAFNAEFEEFKPGLVFLQELQEANRDSARTFSVDTRLSQPFHSGHSASATYRDERRQTLPASSMYSVQHIGPRPETLVAGKGLQPSGRPHLHQRFSEIYRPKDQNFSNRYSQVSGGTRVSALGDITKNQFRSTGAYHKDLKQPERSEELNHGATSCTHNGQHQRRHTLQGGPRLNTIEEQAPWFTQGDNNSSAKQTRDSPSQKPQANMGTTTIDLGSRRSSEYRQPPVLLADERVNSAGRMHSNTIKDSSPSPARRLGILRRQSDSFASHSYVGRPAAHLLSMSRQTSSETLSSGYRSLDRKENLRQGDGLKSHQPSNNVDGFYNENSSVILSHSRDDHLHGCNDSCDNNSCTNCKKHSTRPGVDGVDFGARDDHETQTRNLKTLTSETKLTEPVYNHPNDSKKDSRKSDITLTKQREKDESVQTFGSSLTSNENTSYQPPLMNPQRVAYDVIPSPSAKITPSESTQAQSMVRKKGSPGRNRNVFKGTVLVSILVESYSNHFPDRSSACELGRKLFRGGHIRSIFGAKEFEDSAQLYVWTEDYPNKNEDFQTMTSSGHSHGSNDNISSGSQKSPAHRKTENQLIEEIKEKVLNRSEAYNIVTSYNSFFQELEQDFGIGSNSNRKQALQGPEGQSPLSSQTPYTSTLEHKKVHVHSADSSLEAQNGSKQAKDQRGPDLKPSQNQSQKDRSTHLAADGGIKNPNFHSSSPSKAAPASEHHLLYQDFVAKERKYKPAKQESAQVQAQFSHHYNHEDGQLKQPLPGRTHPHSGNKQSDTMVPEEQIPETKNSPNTARAAMDYDLSNQQSTLSSQVSSSVAPDSLENNIPSHSSSSDATHTKPSVDYPPHKQSSPAARWVVPNLVSTSENSLSSYGKQQARNEPPAKIAQWNATSEGQEKSRPWPESTYSYSDNEKQLLEEMRRMKKEHQNTLRTYESRINKLMAKMHELRNIAEMLENSSNKSSPYGVLPGKLALLNILADKDLDIKKLTPVSEVDQTPPPLPPRPGRGTRVYPNKPIIHTGVSMRPLPWSRIILDENVEITNTIWHGMIEPKFDSGELERLFSVGESKATDKSLYEDICLRRGRSKSLTSVYDSDRSQRIISEMKSLRCSLQDVVQAFASLDCSDLHVDSFAELLELLSSQREIDKIQHHVKRKGAGQLEAPDYLVYELSKVELFRERLDFLRFKNKLQINLFEIDQQLRELYTACDEITTSLSLKHVLETVLSIGNFMNAGTERGQADGFKVDFLNSLKEIQDPSKQGNLLELIMRTYCLHFESEIEFGCPTRFHLPEPSNMRHAAQVSFEDIQRALKELKDELFSVKKNLESLSKREGSAMTTTLKVTSEPFLTSALEALADEQKLLEKTQKHFLKTASYFSHEGQRSSTQEFFQIWASFLHDCKYYWKIAHRNLAKEKFNADLSSKSQVSTSSPSGLNNLKSVMIKQIEISQEESDLKINKEQQLQHINTWIESLGKYAGEVEAENFVNMQLEDEGVHQVAEFSIRQAKAGKFAVSMETSPPYINQNVRTDQSHYNQDYKGQRDARPMDNYQGRESPKPIKATPPNVIKPKALVQGSPTSSPSPSSGLLTQPLSLVPYGQQFQVDSNNNRKRLGHHDDFGFEPLYESLPQDHKNPVASLPQQQPAQHSEISSFSPSLNSPDSEQTHKKNAKFFKSLLKRDHKRPAEDGSSISHQSSKQAYESAPKHKLRNTLLNKISGSGQSRKPNSGSQRQDQSPNAASYEKESPPKPSRHFQHDLHLTAPVQPSRDSDYRLNENRVNNYYNYIPPENPQPENSVGLENPPPLPYRPENLQELAPYPSVSNSNVLTDYQDGIKNDTAQQDNSAFQNRKNYNTGFGEVANSGRIRSRAPIALGSNMSISDAYNKVSELGQPNASSQLQAGVKEKSESGSSNTLTGAGNSLDSKWVKTNPVPVYKAKLIPNYENQTKYDPRFDVGVRGQAEAAVLPFQDQYRQELQKKSEQYSSGGSYPASGQPNLRNTDHGESKTYPSLYHTDRSTGTNQFHASPIVVSRDAVEAGYPRENNHQVPSYNHPFTNPTGQNFGNHSERLEKQSSQTQKEQARPQTSDTESNFIKKPPGWRSSERVSNVQAGDAERKHNDRRAHRSSSANNMLDRDYEANKPMRQAQSAEMDGARGRISRRDMMDKKMTPTSHRDVPQSVTSLIDKFEKKPDRGQPAGLLDIDDKPPSMTSTPVARRKTNSSHQGAAHNEKLPDNFRAYSEGRSRSTGRELDRKQNTQESKSGHMKTLSPDMQQQQQTSRSSKSPHHAVAPFFIHSQPTSSQSHQQRQAEGFNEDGWRGKNGHGYHGPSDQRQFYQNKEYNRGAESNSSTNHALPQPQDDQSHSYPNHASNKGSNFKEKTSSNRSRGSKNSALSFHASQNNGFGQPMTTGHHPHSSNVLHKPEPMYPTALQDSANWQQSNQHHPSARSHLPGGNEYRPSQQLSSFTNYTGMPQQLQLGAQIYPPSQHPQNHSSPPYPKAVSSYSNSPPYSTNNLMSSSQGGADVQQAQRSNHSAFERPSKPGSSYNRQPGAMAVVKPTVLHL